MKINQKGFGGAETLLILIIIGLLVGVGYFVYRSQKATNASLDNANKQLSSLAEQKQSTDKTNYLEVKELGVKFKLGDALQGLYYHIGNNGRTAYFSLDKLRGTGCAADKAAQFAISRYTEDELKEEISAYSQDARKLGDFYFTAIGGQSACTDDDNLQRIASEMRGSLSSILPASLESIE